MSYSDEKNIQILISLLKEHNIRKIVASPGTTNITFVASLQSDPFFQIFSAADERSAAYIACGMAEESGEPVVLSCTGATASRNYIPGLTEAYYRKLPILAVTSTQHIGRVGQNVAQVIDRSVIQNDVAKLSLHIPICITKEDEWANTIYFNRAILELTQDGNGPVHINMETSYSRNYNVDTLPKVQSIHRIEPHSTFPELPSGRIGVFVGAHSRWSERLTKAVDEFCKYNNAVVLCDQTSNYRGEYRVLFSLVTSQIGYHFECNEFDLLIHIGNISGAYPSFKSKEEWRINPDGEIRDTFRHLKYVFKMNEEQFFDHYSHCNNRAKRNTSIEEWNSAFKMTRERITNLPFSNIWVASKLAPRLPEGSALHLGILNTLRSWNFFETPDSTLCYCNTGGFGIDGVLSAAVGASFCDPNKIVFCILGDLAFFYDMNVLGNRQLANNLRVILINNGKGTEFTNYNHPGAAFGEDANNYIAAAGHYGNKSLLLVKHYAEDLGFVYFAATNKEEAEQAIDRIVQPSLTDRPIFAEFFTDSKDESDALYSIMHLFPQSQENIKASTQKDNALKGIIKKAVGKKGIQIYRAIRYDEE